ncbi:MAG: hypothetical protein GY793_01600 [Proteobacteria bacterium]|nr:hypothetical protein [Pseudomonadota bacterium]
MEHLIHSNSKQSDAVYHNECSCLFANNVEDEDCLKRFYHLYDYKNNSFIKLFICNETIRLKLNQIRINKGSTYLGKYEVGKVLDSIFKEYVSLGDGRYYDVGNDLLDRHVHITVCSRPYTYTSIKLTEAIEIYLENNSRLLFNEIKIIILDYMRNITYKKYKTKYESIRRKLKKIDNYGTNKDILMNEVFIEILQTQCKLKKQLINN